LSQFKPLRDQILVRPLDRLKNLSTIIEVVSDEKNTRGEVIAVGPGMINEKTKRVMPMDVKVGDRIVYGNGTYLDFQRIELDGEELLVMREADVCWVEDPEPAQKTALNPAAAWPFPESARKH
jgi:co-chaperonin GroES (HSP10)